MDSRVFAYCNFAFDCGVDTMINFFEMVAKFFVTIIGFLKFLLAGITSVIEVIPGIISFLTSALKILPLSLTVSFGTVLTLLAIKAVKRWLL